MSRIGRYEIVSELGRGAMGVVFLANDPHLHRQVAVKTCTLPDGITEDLARQFRERFLREARAAASLSHPGIVTVYDAGQDEATGVSYIAMEYVKGQTLKQRLESGPRPDPAWIVEFGAVLADALHTAHSKGIVHRDIKPANILIREGDGAVKLADFGVARLKASDLTQTGASIGSPGYMSPEQVRGGALDGRSDLFSLAVVLYEAFCGKRPFRGDDLVSLAFSIAHDTQVPLARQLQGCPAGLDSFFDKALSKDPDTRFPDGAAFKEAFRKVGARSAQGGAERTVVDASTMAMAVGAGQTRPMRPGRMQKNQASGGPPPARRRWLRGASLAALALLVAGAVTAAYLKVGRAASMNRPVAAQDISQAAPPPVDRPAAPSGEAPSPQPRREAAAVEVEPVPAPPRIPRIPANIQVTVPEGTEIHLSLEAGVGSASSHVGDRITARIVDPVIAGERVALPAGSMVHGSVSDAVPATKGLRQKAGGLTLFFDRVVTPIGAGASISESLTRIGEGSGKKTAAAIGGGAAGGALLGRVLGHSNRKAAVGSVLGGAIGTGIAAGTRGNDVDLPAGSPLTIILSRPLTITVEP
jgi:serine/threonine-protein kinase